LYKAEADFEKDFQIVTAMAEKFSAHQGKFTKSAKALLTATDDYNNI
jgi:hypothetical protein